MLKIGTKFIIGIVLALCILLTGIGFARVSDSLSIVTNIYAEAPLGIYIRHVDNPSGKGELVNNSFSNTVLTSSVNLGSNTSNTLTIDVTFFNNSQIDYMYYGTETSDTAYSNSSVTFSVQGLTPAIDGQREGTVVEHGETVVAKVTFSYKDTKDLSQLDSVINFIFKPTEEYQGAQNLLSALLRFETLINDPAKQQIMVDRMKTDGIRYSEDYIGNVAGSETTGDSEVLMAEGMFTVNGRNTLQVDLDEDGVLEDGEIVTIMIKAENVDGDKNTGVKWGEDSWLDSLLGRSKQGYEMTVYMTPIDLSNPESLDINGNPISAGANVTVFAATYTSTDGGTTWTQIGELFHGYASLNDYDGGSGTDSFDTGTWRSSNVYNGVATGSTISQVVQSYK